MIGASSGPGQNTSEISRDTVIRMAGEASLKLSGDSVTNRWYAVYQDIPPGFSTLRIDYHVRAEEIRQEADQFDNCYVGFIYYDGNGSRHFHTNAYEGSFDWRSDSLTLDIEELGATDIQFMIFLSMSGTFWVDELLFTGSDLEHHQL